MDCLKNYIKIEGCEPPDYNPFDDPATPEVEVDDPATEEVVEESSPDASDLFINRDLPGISLKNIDALADEEQKTFLGLWNEMQDRAIKKFVIAVKAGWKELFSVCILKDDEDQWFCDNRQQLAFALLYFLGAELMLERIYSDRLNRYTTVDRDKAVALRKEFQKEFQSQLRNALELINNCERQESGEVFSYVEELP